MVLMDWEGSFAVAALVCPVWGRSCCAALLGAPKVEGECAGGAETKRWRTYQYWQVHCLLVLMYSAFRIHQHWLCCALLVCSSLPAQGVSKTRAAQLEPSCATSFPLDIWFAPFLCAPWWTPVFMESEQQEGNAFGLGQWAPSQWPQGPFSEMCGAALGRWQLPMGLLPQRLPGETVFRRLRSTTAWGGSAPTQAKL